MPAGAADGFKDLGIASTATEITGKTFANLLDRRPRVFGKKVHRGQDHSRRADSALRAVAIQKRFLQGMESVVVRQALDGDDGCVVGLSDRNETAVHQFAVHQHGAGAAFAFAATLFCTCQAQLRSKYVQQALYGMDTNRFCLAVYLETNLLFGCDVGGLAHSVCGDPFRRLLRAIQSGVNVFGQERDETERHAEGILDCIENSGGWTIHR